MSSTLGRQVLEYRNVCILQGRWDTVAVADTREHRPLRSIRFGITKDANKTSILVGLAQVFSASGELVALRAGGALKRKRSNSERGYHMGRDQARVLISGVLKDYEYVTGRLPDRLLIHKSSAIHRRRRRRRWNRSRHGRSSRSRSVVLEGHFNQAELPDRGQPADRGTTIHPQVGNCLRDRVHIG